MGEGPIKIKADSISFKYKGIFSLVDVYKYMIELLMDKGYIKGSNYQFMEKYYSDKTSSTREGHSMWIWWRTKKGEEDQEFFEMHLDIDYHLRYGKQVEVMQEGKKIRAEQGEIEIILNGYLLIDPQQKWEKHWFLKHFREFYVKRLWRKSKDQKKNKVKGDMKAIFSSIKEFFEIEHFHPTVGESFYPQRGIKDNV